MSEQQLPYSEKLRLIKLGLMEKESKPKPKKPIAKISEKKKKELKEAKDSVTGETELQKWFKDRIKYSMTGYCAETGLRTETKVYQYAIMSCCHILPKRLCKSVALHPCNFIELIPDMHTKFDSISWEERETWGCWPEVRNKLVMMWPDLDPSERRHFPQSVLDYMEKNDPF